MAIKAVFFDLDNTLIDFMRMKKISCEAAISAMIDAGLQTEKQKAYDLLFELYGVHGIEHGEIFQEFLKKVMGKIDYRILSRGINAYRKMQVGYLEPYPHVRSTLIALKGKGLILGIVSDAPRMKAWMRLTEMGLADFFDVVVTLDDTGKRKPSKMPFQAASKELKILPAQILFVGDNPSRDIEGAKKVGMKTCLAKYGQIFPDTKTKADFEIFDIQELVGLIE